MCWCDTKGVEAMTELYDDLYSQPVIGTQQMLPELSPAERMHWPHTGWETEICLVVTRLGGWAAWMGREAQAMLLASSVGRGQGHCSTSHNAQKTQAQVPAPGTTTTNCPGQNVNSTKAEKSCSQLRSSAATFLGATPLALWIVLLPQTLSVWDLVGPFFPFLPASVSDFVREITFVCLTQHCCSCPPF